MYEWLADEVMSRNEDQNEIPPKRVAVDVQQLPYSSMWDAFDQVIQGSLTSTVDAPVSDSVVASRATAMQMVHDYVAESTIERMSDPLAGLIYSDHRSRLAAEKAEKLLFIRTNMMPFN